MKDQSLQLDTTIKVQRHCGRSSFCLIPYKSITDIQSLSASLATQYVSPPFTLFLPVHHCRLHLLSGLKSLLRLMKTQKINHRACHLVCADSSDWKSFRGELKLCHLFKKCRETLCLSGNVQGHVSQKNIDFGGRQIFYLPFFLHQNRLNTRDFMHFQIFLFRNGKYMSIFMYTYIYIHKYICICIFYIFIYLNIYPQPFVMEYLLMTKELRALHSVQRLGVLHWLYK